MYSEELNIFEKKLNDMMKNNDKSIILTILKNLLINYKKIEAHYDLPIRYDHDFYTANHYNKTVNRNVPLSRKMLSDFRNILDSSHTSGIYNYYGMSEYIVYLGIEIRKIIEIEKSSSEKLDYSKECIENNYISNIIDVYASLMLLKLYFYKEVVECELDAYIIDNLYQQIYLEFVNKNLETNVTKFLTKPRKIVNL